MAFAEALAKVRTTLGVSWERMADYLGVSDTTLRRWRLGGRSQKNSVSFSLRKAQEFLAPNLIDILRVAYTTTNDARSPPSPLVGRGKPKPGSPNLNADARDQHYETYRLREVLQRANSTPSPPIQTTSGPTLAPTTDGFDVQPSTLPENERLNSSQISLHRRLRTLAEQLKASMPSIENSHSFLVAEFDDYVAFLAADLAELNVTSLWSVGTGLGEYIRALDQARADVMTPELEPGVVARFRTLMATHTAFILGFSEGQELQERVIKAREAAEADPDLQTKATSILRPMQEKPNLLATKAAQIVRSLLRALDVVPHATFVALITSADMARSSIYAFIRVLHPVLLIGEGVDFAARSAGFEHVEVLRAAALFLHENGSHVVALFAHDSQVERWLAWAVAKLHSFNLH